MPKAETIQTIIVSRDWDVGLVLQWILLKMVANGRKISVQ